jgi:hypothetical protein
VQDFCAKNLDPALAKMQTIALEMTIEDGAGGDSQ